MDREVTPYTDTSRVARHTSVISHTTHTATTPPTAPHTRSQTHETRTKRTARAHTKDLESHESRNTPTTSKPIRTPCPTMRLVRHPPTHHPPTHHPISNHNCHFSAGHRGRPSSLTEPLFHLVSLSVPSPTRRYHRSASRLLPLSAARAPPTPHDRNRSTSPPAPPNLGTCALATSQAPLGSLSSPSSPPGPLLCGTVQPFPRRTAPSRVQHLS